MVVNFCDRRWEVGGTIFCDLGWHALCVLKINHPHPWFLLRNVDSSAVVLQMKHAAIFEHLQLDFTPCFYSFSFEENSDEMVRSESCLYLICLEMNPCWAPGGQCVTESSLCAHKVVTQSVVMCREGILAEHRCPRNSSGVKGGWGYADLMLWVLWLPLQCSVWAHAAAE